MKAFRHCDSLSLLEVLIQTESRATSSRCIQKQLLGDNTVQFTELCVLLDGAMTQTRRSGLLPRLNFSRTSTTSTESRGGYPGQSCRNERLTFTEGRALVRCVSTLLVHTFKFNSNLIQSVYCHMHNKKHVLSHAIKLFLFLLYLFSTD
jgi:hypothetical protein